MAQDNDYFDGSPVPGSTLGGRGEGKSYTQALETALVIRINFRVCPDCRVSIEGGFTHDENCAHYVTERNARGGKARHGE